jgi:hypothetical protein
LLTENPVYATAFDISAPQYEANGFDPLTIVINAIDPSAFVEQHTDGITGTLADGGYLVPEDFLGYLATGLDYFLLNSTGLGAGLAPIVEILLGAPSF